MVVLNVFIFDFPVDYIIPVDQCRLTLHLSLLRVLMFVFYFQRIIFCCQKMGKMHSCVTLATRRDWTNKGLVIVRVSTFKCSFKHIFQINTDTYMS